MSETSDPRPLSDVVNAGDVAMFVTSSAGMMSSRPLTVAKVHGEKVSFLTDRRADWMGDVTAHPNVHLAVSASGRNDWVGVSGQASATSDATTIDELWNPAAGAYFDGKDDPNITVLTVDVSGGEYWSGPGGGPFGRLISVVGAAIGKGPGPGDHGPVT